MSSPRFPIEVWKGHATGVVDTKSPTKIVTTWPQESGNPHQMTQILDAEDGNWSATYTDVNGQPWTPPAPEPVAIPVTTESAPEPVATEPVIAATPVVAVPASKVVNPPKVVDPVMVEAPVPADKKG